MVSTYHCFWSRDTFHSRRSVAMGPGSWNSLVLPCFPPSWNSQLERMMGWPFEDLDTASSRWQSVAYRDGARYPEACYALNQHPIYGAVSPRAIIHGRRNQGMKTVVSPITITLNDPLEKVSASNPMTLWSTSLEVSAPEKCFHQEKQQLFNWNASQKCHLPLLGSLGL